MGINEQSVRWLAIAVYALASALFFHYYNLYQTRREAQLEYEARRRIFHEARLKHEHELELARGEVRYAGPVRERFRSRRRRLPGRRSTRRRRPPL